MHIRLVRTAVTRRYVCHNSSHVISVKKLRRTNIKYYLTEMVVFGVCLTYADRSCFNFYQKCNKNQQNAHFIDYCFHLIIVSPICFEHPSVHPQEDLYTQFYGIFFLHPSCRWQDVLDTACTSLLEDEHLDVRNMSKTLKFLSESRMG